MFFWDLVESLTFCFPSPFGMKSRVETSKHFWDGVLSDEIFVLNIHRSILEGQAEASEVAVAFGG